MNPRQTERGAVLVVAMIFLLILTLLGITAMSTTTLQERMAGNLRDNNLAFQSAESALRDGEGVLQQATIPVFDNTDGLLTLQSGSARASYWNAYDWDGNSRTAPAIAGTAEVPRYVIEELPPVPAEGDSLRFGALPDVGFYRVTARAVGGSTDAVSILQATYRR